MRFIELSNAAHGVAAVTLAHAHRTFNLTAQAKFSFHIYSVARIHTTQDVLLRKSLPNNTKNHYSS